MRLVGAAVFEWLQGAGFYRELHRASANLLPDGDGQTWLDAGCGPGLMARIAAQKGYLATGIDRDPRMIESARACACKDGNAARYHVSDLDDPHLTIGRYDVVSASSLLVVVSDPEAMLARLEALVRPGGKVLIIEASPSMSRRHAIRAILSGGLGPRSYMLLAWASVRTERTLPVAIFDRAGSRARCFPILDGLVHAWLIER